MKDPSEKSFDSRVSTSTGQPKLAGDTDYYGIIPLHQQQSFSSLPPYVSGGETVYGVPGGVPTTEKQTDAAISLLRKNLMEEHEKV